MSICPDLGQAPYVSLTGSMVILGLNQSPVGNLARTSTLPYFSVTVFLVIKRADMTGLMTVNLDELETATH
jgi:hypothetical protein